MPYQLYAPTYDYLERRAASHGGVGHTRFYELIDGVTGTPCCIWGMLSPEPGVTALELWDAHAMPLRHAGISPGVSDSAFYVTELDDPAFRLPFEIWATRLGVTRWVPTRRFA